MTHSVECPVCVCKWHSGSLTASQCICAAASEADYTELTVATLAPRSAQNTDTTYWLQLTSLVDGNLKAGTTVLLGHVTAGAPTTCMAVVCKLLTLQSSRVWPTLNIHWLLSHGECRQHWAARQIVMSCGCLQAGEAGSTADKPSECWLQPPNSHKASKQQHCQQNPPEHNDWGPPALLALLKAICPAYLLMPCRMC